MTATAESGQRAPREPMRAVLPAPESTVAPTPRQADPLITLRGSAVHFGAQAALEDVDLTLRRGDRLALVGANGSGKTTLLRLLHGLAPARGERFAPRCCSSALSC